MNIKSRLKNITKNINKILNTLYPNLIWCIIWMLTMFLSISIYYIESSDPEVYVPHIYKKEKSTKDIIKDSLIYEVDIYISNKFPNSQISADSLVNICLKHDFDIIFAIAQGEIESGFGTAGIARKTYSVWNVFSYDGWTAEKIISKGRGYSHPNESIEPYIILIKEKYLGDNKTHEDLLNNYVSLSGYRYATNPRYEIVLKNIYKNIDKNTNIKSLVDSLKN